MHGLSFVIDGKNIGILRMSLSWFLIVLVLERSCFDFYLIEQLH